MSLLLLALKDEEKLNEDDIERLYAIFKQDFIDDEISLSKNDVLYTICVNTSEVCPCPFRSTQKQKRFWHIITKSESNFKKRNNPCPDSQEKDRVFCKDRAKRIHWIKYLIENWQSQEEIRSYYQRHGRDWRLIIWDTARDFLVIIKKLDNSFERFLVTSYIVHGNKRNRYKKELRRYKEEKPEGIDWFEVRS